MEQQSQHKRILETGFSKSRKTFIQLFLFLVVLLLMMPAITSLNELITAWVLHFGWYKSIESVIVPFETRAVVGILNVLHIDSQASTTAVSILKDGSWQKILIIWNCVGWQSIIILILTLLTGLQGKFTFLSKIETALIGILGVFVINIFRITFVMILFKWFGYFTAIIFHDYFASIITIAWFFFFWWFCYTFVLDEVA